MFKSVSPIVFAFDAEWVPDPVTGRLVYDLPPDMPDMEVIFHMWNKGGATAENPTPFLKVVLCRIVSVSAVMRKVLDDGTIKHSLISLPKIHHNGAFLYQTEPEIIGRFLTSIGELKPQLVGYNSHRSDLRIFFQRALVNGLHLPAFCARPDKPWEGSDYFARDAECNIDLYDKLNGFGGGGCSLHEIATACGIPGKFGPCGLAVPEMYFDGRLDEIVAYNETDAITTFLLWLRFAHLGGFISSDDYVRELGDFEEFLVDFASDIDERNTLIAQGGDKVEPVANNTDRDIATDIAAVHPLQSRIDEEDDLYLSDSELESQSGPKNSNHISAYLDEWRRLRSLA